MRVVAHRRRRDAHAAAAAFWVASYAATQSGRCKALRESLGKAMQRVRVRVSFPAAASLPYNVPVRAATKINGPINSTDIEWSATQQVQPCRARGAGCHTFLFKAQRGRYKVRRLIFVRKRQTAAAGRGFEVRARESSASALIPAGENRQANKSAGGAWRREQRQRESEPPDMG